MNSTTLISTPISTGLAGKLGIFLGWSVVFAASVGLSFSITGIIFTFGNFVTHLSSEFGWSRTEISVAFLILTYVMVLTAPVVGAMVDHFGPRKVILPSCFLLGPGIMSLYFLTDNIWHLYIAFFLISLFGAATTPVTYAKAVINWFDKRRGLALGIAMAGTGIGGILAPQIAQFTISSFGWRTGYLVLGALTFLVAFPVVWVFLKESPDKYGLEPEPAPGSQPGKAGAPKPPVFGISTREAVRTKPFWLLMIAFVLIGVTIPGILAHFVPLLVDRGVSPAMATTAMSTFGLSVVFGRVAAGQLMDMFFAPRVAAIFLLGLTLGMVILSMGASGNIVFVAAILVGLAIGAEFDVITFLSSRYFGLKSAGTISGYAFAAFNIGGGIGPAIMGYARDQTGEYTYALWALGSAALISAFLILQMGPYPKHFNAPGSGSPEPDPGGR